MAAAGKPMMPFWVAFALIAVGGGLVIARTAMKASPPLTTETVAPLASGPRGVTMGPDSARVEIMEFSDFECPYCGRFAVLSMPDIKARLLPTGKVRWRFVNFPLTGHTKSPYAHLAASCANEQGRFWEMHDLIYLHQGDWTEAGNPLKDLEGYARQAGVPDMARYQSCISERRTWGSVLADKALGDSIGLGGTPTFFVNGRQLPGTPSVDELLRIADSLTAPAAPAGRARASR